MKAGWFFLGLLGLSGCVKQVHKAVETPSPIHYVREAAWRGDGVWFYPVESGPADQTGLATVYPSDTEDHLTADGENFSQDVMAAAHQTVALPAMLRVTNLENGRQIVVRANDRGPATPHRLIELTRVAADRLGIAEGAAAEVRVQVEERDTDALAQALGGGAPKLDIATAPVGDVMVEDLDTHRQIAGRGAEGTAAAATISVDQPAPDQVWHVSPTLLPLWVEAGTFSEMRYAVRQRALIGGAIQRIGRGRGQQYRVRLGPFNAVGEADSALDQALHAGVSDARIVAETP